MIQSNSTNNDLEQFHDILQVCLANIAGIISTTDNIQAFTSTIVEHDKTLKMFLEQKLKKISFEF